MRIDSYSQIQQLYNVSKPMAGKVSGPSTSFKDRLNISNAGKDMSVAKQAIADAPDIRADRVAELKSALNNGTYDVSSEDFADKIMEKLSQVIA